MKIRFISYGHKFYEGEGKAAPNYDFLFSLRDLKNPYWIPELKDFHGLQQEIIEFFEKDSGSQTRLNKIIDLTVAFIEDFISNESRNPDDTLCFAFKCTGGKHRSVYFAQTVFNKLKDMIEHNPTFKSKLELEVEHIDLPKYLTSQH